MIFPTHVNGIPCQCQVVHHAPPVSSTWNLPPEGEEFTYELLDQQGRRAKWLDRYITPDVDERMLDEFRLMGLADYLNPYDD